MYFLSFYNTDTSPWWWKEINININYNECHNAILESCLIRKLFPRRSIIVFTPIVSYTNAGGKLACWSHYCLLTSWCSRLIQTLTRAQPLPLPGEILSVWTDPSVGGWGTGGVTPCGSPSWLPHWGSLFPPCCMLAPTTFTSAKWTLGTPEP